MFNASLSTVMLSVLVRNAVVIIPASHFQVQMPVSLTSLGLEFFSSRQLLLKFVLMCFLVFLVVGCFFQSMVGWQLIEESMRWDHR